MPLSRARQPAADLFRIAGAQEPSHNRNFAPAAAAANTTDKSSPRRHVLPKDLSNALKQLDDLELDGFLRLPAMNCNDAARCFQVSQQFNRRAISAHTIARRFNQQRR